MLGVLAPSVVPCRIYKRITAVEYCGRNFNRRPTPLRELR